DAVLIGPGLSLNSETGELVINVIMNCKKNVIADADALTHIAGSVDILKNRNSDSEIILTPHIGEFSRLTGCSVQDILKSRFQVVRDFCKNYNVNLVLKSETSISVLKSGEIFINPTGSELLATAGSGDVLSGIMVSLLAMSKNPMTSMICANFIHGLAADIYSAKHFLKQSALQRDIIELIPDAISAILN
ncbi:MAG: NAD(P)H-hydrate dehydratase, partial [Ignavibacteria bacterium]|nr:NAD(P)H-hydrate dehydratase [Ignavibacteria bacterium]